MAQSVNVTKQKLREEVEFNIAAGERESNAVKCDNKSLLAALMLQNIESDNVEVLGSIHDEVYHPLSWNDEELGLSVLEKPWAVNHAYYPGFKDVSEDESSPTGMFMSPDKKMMFIVGTDSVSVHAYKLVVAGDPTTALKVATLDVSAQFTTPQDIFFKSDGSRMFLVGNTSDKVYSYKLSNTWDINEAEVESDFDVSAQEGSPRGVFFKPNGRQMFIIGQNSDAVHSYSLRKAWGISTAKYDNVSFDVSSETTIPRGLFFRPDGSQMFVSDPNAVYAYDLTGDWDTNTANLADTNNTGHGSDVFFDADGESMYMVDGVTNAFIHKYTMSTVWDITTGDSPAEFDVSNEEGTPTAVAFRPDGSQMFVVGSDSATVYAYNLATTWKSKTATLAGSFDVSGQESSPTGIALRPDGSQMFIVGSGSNSVHAYDLSDIWDVTSASLDDSFDLSGHDGSPSGIAFKEDGLRMFILDKTPNPIPGPGNPDKIYSYDLSSAWDVAMPSLDESLDISGEDSSPTGIEVKPDGRKLFLIGTDRDLVQTYNLSTAWELQTATLGEPFDVSGQDGMPRAIAFKTDGTRMFMAGSDSASIFSYDLKRNTWISIGEPSLTKAYPYLKMRTSEAESGDRIIKGIIGV